jgi:bacillithiol biosynthesis cysteine-adding enzyme BshC
VSHPLSGRSLTTLAVSGDAPESWYKPRPHGASEWNERGAAVAASVGGGWLARISAALNASGNAARRLESAARGGFVVTTGQQPGLFGGPLYTWWKAIGAVALADALQELTGRPVAPVFWAATDDSDLVEAATTYILTADGPLPVSIRAHAADGSPMSEVPLGDVTSQLSALRQAAGSAANERLLERVERAYSEGATVGSAYVELLRDTLAEAGVSVLDASHPTIGAAAHPLLVSALERGSEIEASLVTRDAEIAAAGHRPQVQTVKGRTLVFRSVSGRRDRVRIARANQTAAATNAGELSPNVVLRPIVERAILPTVAYLGGPAEVAYFAQVSAVASALGVEPPLVLPRWSATIIEPRIERILHRYRLGVRDFSDPHAVETKIARESLPPAVRASLDSLRAEVSARLASLSAVEGAELIPKPAIEGAARNAAHRLARLERRFIAAIKRQGSEALRDIATARASLFPLGQPQERVLNGVPFLARYGDELWDAALSEASQHAASLI